MSSADNISVDFTLLISFTHSLDPDQATNLVGPDLDPNCLTLIAFLKKFWKKLISGKNQQSTINMQNYPEGKELIIQCNAMQCNITVI